MTPARVRFAPSPTGPLHVGGARTALFNLFVAKQTGGTFVLRIDDTDRERSQAGYEQDIVESLRWLGIGWDEGPDCGGPSQHYRQSERTGRYDSALGKLLLDGSAFRDQEGVVRLRYPKGEIVVDDLICGECRFTADSLGPEPALQRSDGSVTYHLASVVDDIEMQITHIIRGQDHLTNTAKHVVLFRALDASLPHFAHLPLILGEDRTKLSKRNSEGLTSVSDFREAGYHPEALVNFLMLLGWSHPEAKEHLLIADVVPVFELGRVSTTAAVFERRRLEHLNGYWMRHLPAELVAARSSGFLGTWRALIACKGEAFWLRAVEALRDGMASLRDAEYVGALLCADELPAPGHLVAEAGGSSSVRCVAESWSALLDEFPPEEGDTYSATQFAQLSALLKKRSGQSGPALFKPLRLAVTGSLSGFELKVLIPLISHQNLRSRVHALLSSL